MKKLFSVFLLLVFTPMLMKAQEQGINRYFRDNMYVFDSTERIMSNGFFTTHADELGITSNDVFTPQVCNNQENGRFDCRYLQYHKGYLVEGTSFILHGIKGVVLYAGGNQIKNLDVPVSNPMSESDALSIALQQFSGSTFEWQVDSIMDGYQEMFEDTNYTTYPQGTLLIAQNQDGTFQSDDYKLCWKFTLVIVHPTTENVTIYVDALSGDVFSSFDSKEYAQFGTGTVQTEYDGSQSFRTWKCTFCTNWKLQSDKKIVITTGVVPEKELLRQLTGQSKERGHILAKGTEEMEVIIKA
jgi:Zn-dependent metalloprotease